MRPYAPGEDVTNIFINKGDLFEDGGMIARCAKNPEYQWYIGKQYFLDKYIQTPVEESEG